MAARRAHYVVSTHWDREWYQAFQDYRYRLVQLLDRVIAGLEEGRLRGPFTCDGQAIVLEDYLEVRPERRATVERLVREGLLVVGPWYVLPDELLVSGESLVRNLRLGRQVARDLGGKPSNAGFVCDIFGHSSQLPQIMAGFGIRGGFVWRGTNAIETYNVLWRGADGTEMPCYRFGHSGYCGYAMNVRHARAFQSEFSAEEARADLQAFLEDHASRTVVDPILLFDGCDHQEWDEEAYQVILERLGEERQGFEVVHSTLDAYLAEMLPQAERIERVLEGELREAARYTGDLDSQWLIPGVLSSRVWIKQWNARCQTLLTAWAEPFSAWAHAGADASDPAAVFPQGYLDVAWRWLLKNHPHDSICGCSIDRVHEDMKYRFSQCEGIAERLTIEATRKIAASVAGDLPEESLRLALFNPVPAALDESAEVTLQIPTHWPSFNEFFGFEPKPAFRILDAAGQEVPYQRLGQAMGRIKTRLRDARVPESYRTDDIRVSLPVALPATGYATYTVVPGEAGRPTRYGGKGLATSERSMANEHLAVEVGANGSLTVEDLESGAHYERLLTLEDVADIGDGWYWGMASADQQFTSTGAAADVALVHDGPFLTTFRVRVTMHVPAAFSFDVMRRDETLVPLVVEHLVSLRPGCRRVEVETTVHNSVRDHRLRLLFPTGATTETFLTDTPFDVVERAVALPEDNHTYRELDVETRPQQTWTAVYGGGRGLAVIAPGLYETAVRDLPERPIALTLLRATRRTVMTDGEPNGQLQGDLRYRCWLVPLAESPDVVALGRLAQQAGAGLRDVQLRPADVALRRQPRPMPPSASLLSLEGNALVTSARRVGEAFEVRLFNPTTRGARVTLGLGETLGAFQSARRVDLESQPAGEPLPFGGGALSLSLRPKEIATLRFE